MIGGQDAEVNRTFITVFTIDAVKAGIFCRGVRTGRRLSAPGTVPVPCAAATA